jgi:hypothetical protein
MEMKNVTKKQNVQVWIAAALLGLVFFAGCDNGTTGVPAPDVARDYEVYTHASGHKVYLNCLPSQKADIESNVVTALTELDNMNHASFDAFMTNNNLTIIIEDYTGGNNSKATDPKSADKFILRFMTAKNGGPILKSAIGIAMEDEEEIFSP